MPVIHLTETVVKNLTCPPDKKRIEFVDADPSARGMYVLTSRGSDIATFMFRYKDNTRKTRHVKIGRTTDITLAEARKQAKTLRAEIALGADPRGEAKAKKAIPTLHAFFNDEFLPYAKARKRSWIRDIQLFQRIDAKFGPLRLNEITRKDFSVFLTSVLDEGLAPASANHHTRLLRSVLNRAISWQIIDRNPLTHYPMFDEDNKKERYMNDVELKRLVGVLETHPNRMVCNICMWLLSTGARCGETLNARWDHVDRKTRTWRIPAANNKGKRVRSVPLNDSALGVLGVLGTENHSSGYLFVSPKTGEPYDDISKAWQAIRKEAALPKLRLHDLRHQYASLLVSAGHSLYSVQMILGHSDPSVTQRYAHLSTTALQDAANAASVRIKGVMQEKAEVEPAEQKAA